MKKTKTESSLGELGVERLIVDRALEVLGGSGRSYGRKSLLKDVPVWSNISVEITRMKRDRQGEE